MCMQWDENQVNEVIDAANRASKADREVAKASERAEKVADKAAR